MHIVFLIFCFLFLIVYFLNIITWGEQLLDRSMIRSDFLFWLSISIMSLTIAFAFLSGYQLNFQPLERSMYKLLFDKSAFKTSPFLFILLWITFLFALWCVCKFSLEII